MLQISLLGPPQISLHNSLLVPHLSKKAQALLYYLITTPRLHPRVRLASLFWSDIPDAQARKNLRNILPEIRNCLADYLYIDADVVGFRDHNAVEVDVVILQRALSDTNVCNNPSLLLEAVALYRGDFLEGFFIADASLYEEWATSCREHNRYLVVDRLYKMAKVLLDSKDIAMGMQVTRRLLQIERWHEAAHRIVINLLLLDGQRSAAISHYHYLHSILQNELGIEPDDVTESLYHQILATTHPTSPRSIQV